MTRGSKKLLFVAAMGLVVAVLVLALNLSVSKAGSLADSCRGGLLSTLISVVFAADGASGDGNACGNDSGSGPGGDGGNSDLPPPAGVTCWGTLPPPVQFGGSDGGNA